MSYIPAPDRYEQIPYRRCGRSGILLPAISIGLWHNFGDITPFGTQRDILRKAFDLGIGVTGADDKIVGEDGAVANAEQFDVGGFLFIENLNDSFGKLKRVGIFHIMGFEEFFHIDILSFQRFSSIVRLSECTLFPCLAT